MMTVGDQISDLEQEKEEIVNSLKFDYLTLQEERSLEVRLRQIYELIKELTNE